MNDLPFISDNDCWLSEVAGRSMVIIDKIKDGSPLDPAEEKILEGLFRIYMKNMIELPEQ